MKSRIALLVLTFSLLAGFQLAAQNCNISNGDVFSLSVDSVNILSGPKSTASVSGRLVSHHSRVLILHVDSVLNNFVKVAAFQVPKHLKLPESYTTSGEWYLNRLYNVLNTNFNRDTFEISHEHPEGFKSHNYPIAFVDTIIVGWIWKQSIKLKTDGMASYSLWVEPRDEMHQTINIELDYKTQYSCHFNPTRLAYAYNHLGQSYFLYGEYTQAIRYFTLAIDAASNNSTRETLRAYYYRGMAKLAVNDNYGAEIDLKYVIGCQRKTSSEFQVNFGWPSYKSNMFDQEMIPNEWLYVQYARTLIKLDKHIEALPYLNLVVENKADYSSAYYYRAVVYLKIKDKKRACLEASKAGQLGSEAAYDFIEESCK